MNEEPIRVVHVQSDRDNRSWWPVWMIGAIAGLFASITVGFTLITTTQRAEKAEERSAISDDTFRCWAILSSYVSEKQQAADSALRELVSLITRQVIATTAPVRENFEAALTRLEELNIAETEAVTLRDDWLNEGSPLPCPISSTGGS